jgi:trafficking protein particle complex subunit 6
MSARTSLQAQPPSAQMFASAAATPPAGGLAMLVDPPTRLMDSAAMDYFIIEMVETLRSSSSIAVARSKQIEREMVEAGLIPPPPPVPVPPVDTPTNPRDSTGSLVSVTKSSTVGPRSAAAAVMDEAEEAVRYRLELIGMHVGANFTERLLASILALYLDFGAEP